MAPLQCYSDISKTDLQKSIYLGAIGALLSAELLVEADGGGDAQVFCLGDQARQILPGAKEGEYRLGWGDLGAVAAVEHFIMEESGSGFRIGNGADLTALGSDQQLPAVRGQLQPDFPATPGGNEFFQGDVAGKGR